MTTLSNDLSLYITSYQGKQMIGRNAWSWVNAGFSDAAGWSIGAYIGGWIGIYTGGIYGGMIGGNIGRVSLCGVASAAALLATDCVPTNDFILNQNNECDELGVAHNAIVSYILKNKDSIIVGNKIDMNRLRAVAVEAVDSIGYDISNLEVDDVANVVEKTYNLSYSTECVNNFYNDLIKQHPKDSEILEINKQYVLKAKTLNSKEDLIEFTNGFENIVSKSLIKVQDRRELLGSSSILKNSMVSYENGVIKK